MSLLSLLINLICQYTRLNDSVHTISLTWLGVWWSAWWPDSRSHPWGTPSLFPAKPKQVVMLQMHKFTIPLK